MNLALWIAQGLLAIGFLFAGGFKFVAYSTYAAMIAKQGQKPASRPLAAFVGVAEVAGAIGVVLPMVLNIVPALSAWAAVGLAAIMLMAIGWHLRNDEPFPTPIVLLLLAAFVAFGRFSNA